MNADLTVHTWRTSEYRYLVTPPDPEIYEEIRRLVPADRLDYDPLRKVWRIRGVYWLSLKRALEGLGYGRVCDHQSRAAFEHANPAAAGAELTVHSHEAFETLFLLPGAPDSVVEAAYRALAKLYHPDMGGDLKRMMELNEARAAIKASAWCDFPADSIRLALAQPPASVAIASAAALSTAVARKKSGLVDA